MLGVSESQVSLTILTDLDGTLVPHPYHSGERASDRAKSVQKLHRLISSEEMICQLGCVTGRSESGWERLFQDAALNPPSQTFLGLEFGGKIFCNGTLRHEEVPSDSLQELTEAVKSHLSRCVGPMTSADETMAKGELFGYFIESKTGLTQMDWSFQTEKETQAFEKELTNVVNPLLLKHPTLVTQGFPNRLDVLKSGFHPKAEAATHFLRWLTENGQQTKQSILLVLGDELYDDYLFESCHLSLQESFLKVESISVGKKLPHATGWVNSPDECWDLIGRYQKGNFSPR